MSRHLTVNCQAGGAALVFTGLLLTCLAPGAPAAEAHLTSAVARVPESSRQLVISLGLEFDEVQTCCHGLIAWRQATCQRGCTRLPWSAAVGLNVLRVHDWLVVARVATQFVIELVEEQVHPWRIVVRSLADIVRSESPARAGTATAHCRCDPLRGRG
jgi:hypothetical protein